MTAFHPATPTTNETNRMKNEKEDEERKREEIRKRIQNRHIHTAMPKQKELLAVAVPTVRLPTPTSAKRKVSPAERRTPSRRAQNTSDSYLLLTKNDQPTPLRLYLFPATDVKEANESGGSFPPAAVQYDMRSQGVWIASTISAFMLRNIEPLLRNASNCCQTCRGGEGRIRPPPPSVRPPKFFYCAL